MSLFIINNFVSDYYKKLSLSDNFKLDSTTESYLFKLFKNVEIAKAANMEREFWLKSMSKLCNLSMTLGSFPDACKIAKIKLLFNKS